MYNKFSKGEDIRDSITSSSFPALSKIEAWDNSERRVYTILERPIRNLFENSNETSFILNHLQKMFKIGNENFVLSGLDLVKTTGANVYATLTPGIFVYNGNIYSIYPTPYTASRQLETDLGFVKFDGSDYINIFYENDEFRAEVSINGASIAVENSARGIGLLENLKTALESASISTTGLKSLVEYQLEPCFIAIASTQFINFNGTKIEAVGTASGLNFGSFSNTDVTKNNAIIWSGLITDSIKDNSIDNTKLADMPAFSIKGNKTDASADPQDINEEDLKIHFHMVDTNDIQTISATKTFSADQKIDNTKSLIFKDVGVETGWALSNDALKAFSIKNNTTTVIGISDANKTTVTGDVAISGKTDITGITGIDGDFTVTANAAGENITLTGPTDITGSTNVDGDFTVTANAEGKNITLTGPTFIFGATEIDGDFNITTTVGEVASVNDDVIATLTDTQALTNKTYEGLTITDSTGKLTIANSKTLSVQDNTTVGANTITLANTEILDLTNASLTIGDATGTGNITIKSDDADPKALKLDSDIEIDGNGKKLTVSTGNLSINSKSTGSSLTLPSTLTIEAMPTSGNVLFVDGANIIGSEAQLSTTRGGTGIGTYNTGDIIYSSNGNTLSKLEIKTADKFLRSTGTVPAWSTTTIPDTIAKGSVLVANTENALTAVTNGATGKLKVLQADNDTISWNSVTGTGSAVYSTSPTLITPILGVATATSINKVVINAPSVSATLDIANGKTFTVNNTLTFAGTDSKTMTFPNTNQNIVGETSTQTLTNKTMSTDSTWNGKTVSVDYGGTGATTFTKNAIIVGNGTGSIQTPGPTLTSTEFAFGGAGTVKSTGDLTLTPFTKTITAKPFEITAGGITVSADGATINGSTSLKCDVNNELNVQSTGIIGKGNVSLTLPAINPSFSITSNTAETILYIDNDSIDAKKKLNTEGGIVNTGTITSTGNITSEAQISAASLSVSLTTLNSINVAQFNSNTINNTALASSDNTNLHILATESGIGKEIKKIKFSGLPVANNLANGLMTPEMVAHLAYAYSTVGGEDQVDIVASVNGIGPTDELGAPKTAGDVKLYADNIKMSATDATFVKNRITSIEALNTTQATELTRLATHVPVGSNNATTPIEANKVIISVEDGGKPVWGNVSDSQLGANTITRVSPKDTTGTSVAKWLPLAFWNSSGNGLLRDHDLVYNQEDDTLTATNVTSRSSRTVKKDIETYNESAFDILDQIEVVSFHYIADETQADKVGFIAEDSPELVAGINHDKMEMGNCIGLLIKAVQELKKENEELRDIINGYHNA